MGKTENKEHKAERATGQNREDMIEGRNPVMEALKAGHDLNKLLVSRNSTEGSIKKIKALAKGKGTVVQEVDRRVLDTVSVTGAHQGVIAFAAAASYVKVDDILENARSRGEDPFIVVLDGLTDGRNLGSVIRTAECAGVHGVIIPRHRSAGLDSFVAKASAGAVEYLPVARVTNISRTLDYLKENRIWVAGTDTEGDKAFYEWDLTGPIALVVGSEGSGMRRLVSEKCDYIVKIPVAGSVSSLNASVAAGIVMYEVYRQRNC